MTLLNFCHFTRQMSGLGAESVFEDVVGSGNLGADEADLFCLIFSSEGETIAQ